MEIKLTLPLPDRGLLPNTVCHWAKKARLKKTAREQARRAMFEAMRLIEAEVWLIKKCTLHAYFKTKRHWDTNAVNASFKHYEDGIADAVRQDDNTFRYGETERFTDTKNPRLEIIILIEELV